MDKHPLDEFNCFESVEQWESLPKKYRVKRGWYICPKYYSGNSITDWFDGEGFDDYLKKHHPIQRFFREVLFAGQFWPAQWFVNRYGFRRWWYEEVRCRIKPRAKWLFDKIGRTHSDERHIIQTTLFECTVHFVEAGGGLETLRYQKNAVDDRTADQIEWCYNWIKKGREELKTKIDQAWDATKDKPKDASYKDVYGEVNKLEILLDKTDRICCRKIAANYQRMWL